MRTRTGFGECRLKLGVQWNINVDRVAMLVLRLTEFDPAIARVLRTEPNGILTTAARVAGTIPSWPHVLAAGRRRVPKWPRCKRQGIYPSRRVLEAHLSPSWHAHVDADITVPVAILDKVPEPNLH